jgi:hypothetical protein
VPLVDVKKKEWMEAVAPVFDYFGEHTLQQISGCMHITDHSFNTGLGAAGGREEKGVDGGGGAGV